MKKVLLFLVAVFGMMQTTNAQSDVDAVVFSHNKTDLDESFLISDSVVVTFTKDDKLSFNAVNKGVENTVAFGEDGEFNVDFGKSFLVTANRDTVTDKYLATFYSSRSAYKLDDEFSAYICEREEDPELLDDEVAVLHLININEGIIPAGEGVVLRKAVGDNTAKSVQLRLMPSASTMLQNKENMLTGSDTLVVKAKEKTYALSRGKYGVGFYDFTDKQIPANRSFLYLAPELGIKAIRFAFDDDEEEGNATDIASTTKKEATDEVYNLQGLRVNDNYNGIVIVGGKKYLKK